MIYGYLMERQMQHIKHASGNVDLMHDCLGTRSVRTFKPLTHRGQSVYADASTGTLYDATTGDCLSSGQMRILLDVPVKATRRRKDTAAREHEGWMNDRRRNAA